jgi:hypothetical protein
MRPSQFPTLDGSWRQAATCEHGVAGCASNRRTVAAGDDNDIEIGCGSIKDEDMDPRSESALPSEELSCVNTHSGLTY